MTIYCNNLEEFYNAIAACVERGLTFDARHSDMTINLTGGF